MGMFGRRNRNHFQGYGRGFGSHYTTYTPGKGNSRREGGKYDALGHLAHTYQEYLAGRAGHPGQPPVTVALKRNDPRWGTVFTVRGPDGQPMLVFASDTGSGLRHGQVDIASSSSRDEFTTPLWAEQAGRESGAGSGRPTQVASGILSNLAKYGRFIPIYGQAIGLAAGLAGAGVRMGAREHARRLMRLAQDGATSNVAPVRSRGQQIHDDYVHNAAPPSDTPPGMGHEFNFPPVSPGDYHENPFGVSPDVFNPPTNDTPPSDSPPGMDNYIPNSAPPSDTPPGMFSDPGFGAPTFGAPGTNGDAGQMGTWNDYALAHMPVSEGGTSTEGFFPIPSPGDVATQAGANVPTNEANPAIPNEFLPSDSASPDLSVASGAAAPADEQIAATRPMNRYGSSRSAQPAMRDFGNLPVSALSARPPSSVGMFGGLPSGWEESNRFGHGAPNFTYNGPEGSTGYGPQWTGDSIFNANNLGTAPNAVAPRTFAPGQVGSSSVPAPGGWSGVFGGGSSGNLGSFGDKIAMQSFRHTLFNMDNGRANAYSAMKYMSNNGFGSSAPWAKDMPTWNEFNQQWDKTLADYRAGRLNFRGPTRQQRRDAKGGPGPYGPNSRMMQGT